MDFTGYKFIYGKVYDDANVYIFQKSDNDKLYISEKIGVFETGETSRYLLFEYHIGDMVYKQYIDRQSEEFKQMTIIRPIIDNLNNIVTICQGCNTIVYSEDITSGKADKCKYCDMYLCKKCKKFYPLAMLEDRICENCRKEDKNGVI